MKKILKKQIENNVDVFWVFNEHNKEFIMIHKIINKKLKIYTPKQLLEYLNESDN